MRQQEEAITNTENTDTNIHDALSSSPFESVCSVLSSWFRLFVSSVSNNFRALGCAGNEEHIELQEEEEEQKLHDAIQTLLGNSSCSLDEFILNFTENISIVRHCQQSEIWDCGVTCLLMVLRWLSDVDSRLKATYDLSSLSQNDDTVIDTKSKPSDANKTFYNPSRDIKDSNYDSCRYGDTHTLSEVECTHKQIILDMIQTESIWTIDLVITIHNLFSKNNIQDPDHKRPLETTTQTQKVLDFRENYPFTKRTFDSIKVSYLYCSTNLGVNQSYHNLNYYRNGFNGDEVRVKNLFTIARNEHIPMLQISNLDIKYVCHMLSHENCVAIALLDSSILRHQSNSMFTGHYVLLCGISFDQSDIAQAEISTTPFWGRGEPNNHYEDSTNTTTTSSSSENNKYGSKKKKNQFCFVMKNPGSSKATEFITVNKFEKSWRANGTDHDIIFISYSLI